MFFATPFSRGFHNERGYLMKSMKKEVLFSKEVINGRIRELADEISRDYAEIGRAHV